jgi:hypothetical protein
MKNKLTFMVIGAIAAIALTYGVAVFAEQTSDSVTSQEVKGVFSAYNNKDNQLQISVDQNINSYTLAKSVWVYRDNQKATLNDLKPGDRLDIIFNTKNQAAYIKAYSGLFPAPADTGTNSTTAAGITETVPDIKPEAITNPKPNVTSKVQPKDEDDDSNNDKAKLKQKSKDHDKHEDKREDDHGQKKGKEKEKDHGRHKD